jgi:predicted DNA-binding WGR domain protein
MTSEEIYLEFSSKTSHKFYEVATETRRVIIRYGRIGCEGRLEEHDFESEEQAQSFARGKVEQKLRKGYRHAQPGVTEKRSVEGQILDEQGRLWRLIELSRKGSEGDVYVQLENLRRRLLKLSEEELRRFDTVLWDLMQESYRADLWGAAYIINGGCSDDGFDYFRGWLILQGEKAFCEALRNPDSLASRVRRSWEIEGEFFCEDALSIAAQAYEEKTGRADWYETQPARQMTGLKGDLDAWEDVDTTQENARRLYPRLCKLCLSSEGDSEQLC